MPIFYSENESSSSGNVPPTLELNALARKRDEPVVYIVKYPLVKKPSICKPRYPQFATGYAEKQEKYRVTLKVGDREFIGRGVTEEAGRHDAASRALETLKQLPIPGECPSIVGASSIVDSNASIADKTTIIENDGSSSNVAKDPNAEIKSPVSLLEGPSEKVSENPADTMFLEELKRLLPLPAWMTNFLNNDLLTYQLLLLMCAIIITYVIHVIRIKCLELAEVLCELAFRLGLGALIVLGWLSLHCLWYLKKHIWVKSNILILYIVLLCMFNLYKSRDEIDLVEVLFYLAPRLGWVVLIGLFGASLYICIKTYNDVHTFSYPAPPPPSPPPPLSKGQRRRQRKRLQQQNNML